MSKVKDYLLEETEFLDEMYAMADEDDYYGPDDFAFREEPDEEHSEDISFEELSALLEMETFFAERGREPSYEEMSKGY